MRFQVLRDETEAELAGGFGYVYSMSVLVVAALKSEVRFLLQTWGIHSRQTLEKHAIYYQCDNGAGILRTGVGLPKTARVLNRLPGPLPGRMLHIGVSGALNDELKIGDIVQAVGYSNTAGERIDVDVPRWHPASLTFSRQDSLFVSVPKAVKSVRERRDLREKTQADVVDMESFAVARFCANNQIPLLTLRIVSDHADDSAMLTFIREFRTQSRHLQELVVENLGMFNES